MQAKAERATLWLVGLGMEGTGGLSRKTLDVLGRAGQVLGFRSNLAVDLGDRFVDLSDLYTDGQRDEQNYSAIIDCVTSSISAGVIDVCLVLPGHPVFGVSLARRLARKSAADGFRLEVLPACSSFDLIVAHTTHDPLERGTVLVDANRLLLFDFRIDPSLDCYIFHASSVASPVVNRRDPKLSNRIELLQDKLEAIYGRDKALSMCRVNVDALSMTNIPLSALASHVHEVSFNTTLFILGNNPSIDRSFAARLVQ